MVEFLKTLAIACIPAIITGIVTYIVARKNAASQISIIKEQNKHDLEKLMEQHKVDIEHLKEAHRLDMEAKEQDHKNKLELQKKEFEKAQTGRRQKLTYPLYSKKKGLHARRWPLWQGLHL